MRTGMVMAGSLVAFLVATSGSAGAQTRTSQFSVRATVQKDCQVTAVDLDFGAYRTDTASNGSTPLQVKCTPGTPATVRLDAGSSGKPQAREMRSGADTLGYQLYRDAAHQDPIDKNNQNAFELTAAANAGQTVTFTVYGQIPSGQSVPAGNYVDTIQVTVQF